MRGLGCGYCFQSLFDPSALTPTEDTPQELGDSLTLNTTLPTMPRFDLMQTPV